jgi:hypothetical protein
MCICIFGCGGLLRHTRHTEVEAWMEVMRVPIMESFHDATELAGPVMHNVKRFALSLSLSLSLVLSLSLFLSFFLSFSRALSIYLYFLLERLLYILLYVICY